MSLKSFQHDVGSSSAQLRVITSGIPPWFQHTGYYSPRVLHAKEYMLVIYGEVSRGDRELRQVGGEVADF